MMNPDPEIRRLRDMMPASSRMMSKIVSQPEQAKVIDAAFPLPWSGERQIRINFDLWGELTRAQRDLLILWQVSWLSEIRWFKPDLYQGLVLVGMVGVGVQLVQGDAVGAVGSGGLVAIAATQIWRSSRSDRLQLNADEAAIRVAQRRGYSETEAARHLLSAIEAVARIEGQRGLTFTELVRCQNLRALGGLSAVSMPETFQ